MFNRNARASRFLATTIAAAVAVFAHPPLEAQDGAASIGSLETDTDRWIQLQSQIAKARSEWKSESALLENTIALLETEQAALRQNLESNKKASELLVANRDRLAASLAQQSQGLAALETPLREVEQSVRKLYPRLPEPLRQQLDGNLEKLQAVDEGTAPSLSTRAQALVASLATIDRFSNSVTLARETRPGPESQEVSARVLYWGLAGAYGIDPANQRAWVIEPTSEGWSWTERPDRYPQIESLIASYESEADEPQLILLPATLN